MLRTIIQPLREYYICYIGLCGAPPLVNIGGKILYHLICEMHTLDENATVGERIRFYRTKRHILGNTLAEMVGLSRYAIMYYENNQTEPLLEDLKKIAHALGVEADVLYDDYYRFLDYPYSAKIKEIRKVHGLYQRELGEMMGVSRRAAERWESGKNVVSRSTWERLESLSLL